MLRHFLASRKYGLLHTPDTPTRREEHLRRTLGTLSGPLAYSSLSFIRYLPGIKRTLTKRDRDKPRQGVRGKHTEPISQWGRLRTGADVVTDFIVHKTILWR